MKDFSRRFLAILLTAALLTGSLPFPATADDILDQSLTEEAGDPTVISPSEEMPEPSVQETAEEPLPPAETSGEPSDETQPDTEAETTEPETTEPETTEPETTEPADGEEEEPSQPANQVPSTAQELADMLGYTLEELAEVLDYTVEELCCLDAETIASFYEILTSGTAPLAAEFEITDGVLTKYNGTAENVVIPDEVTSIASGAFEGNTTMVTLVIPAGVTSIANGDMYYADDGAFEDCTALQRVEILSEGLTVIGADAFSGCSRLTAVVLPSGLKKINRDAFRDCKALTDINLPQGLTTVGETAFYNCAALAEVELPDTLTTMGDGAFRKSGLVSITIPGSLTVIPMSAFQGCPNLETLIISEGVTAITGGDEYIADDGAFEACGSLTRVEILSSVFKTIGRDAFQDCTSLTRVMLADNVQKINACAFYNCKTLRVINLPRGLTTIGETAFYNCAALAEVELPDTLTTMGDGAFRKSGLVSITIPGSLTVIPMSAFQGCPNLETLIISEGVTAITGGDEYIADDGAFEACGSLTRVEILSSVFKTIGRDTFQDCTSLTRVMLADNVQKINACAFYNCKTLRVINLPQGLTTIGETAFYNCAALAEVELPDTLTTMGDGAFRKSGLVSIIIPGSLTVIPMSAFQGCPNLETLIISEGVTAITGGDEYIADDGAFEACGSLTRVEIRSSVFKTIGRDTFQDCTSLTRVMLPDNIRKINACAFYNCKVLRNINLPQGLTTIGETAFYNCAALAEVELPDTLTTMGDGAFRKSGLVSITIPGSLTVIPMSAFQGCPNLETLIISEGVTSITAGDKYTADDGAFEDCKSLTAVDIQSTVLTSIGGEAFLGCTLLQTVLLPEGLKKIDRAAFEGCAKLLNLTLPSTVATFEELPFKNCTGLTLWVYEGSSSHTYCQDQGLPYKLVSSEPALSWKTVPEDLKLPADLAQTYTLEILSNQSWTVTAPEWLQAAPAQGTGDAAITLTVPSNTGAQRSGQVVISAEGCPDLVLNAVQACGSQGPAIVFTSHVDGDQVEAGTSVTVTWQPDRSDDYTVYMKLLDGQPVPGSDNEAGQAVPFIPNENQVSFQIPEAEGKYIKLYVQGSRDGVLSEQGNQIYLQIVALNKVRLTGNQEIALGTSTTLKAVEPDGTAIAAKNLTWTTSDSSVVTVSASGKITGKQLGSATVSAVREDGSYGSVIISVMPKAVGIAIAYQNQNAGTTIALDLNQGNQVQLTAGVSPEGASRQVAWKSSNAKIAVVDSSGLVTLLKTGKVTITATASDGSGKKDTVTLNITSSVQTIAITGPREVAAGKSIQLAAEIAPETATNQSVVWSSSDSAIATVSSSGKVTARKTAGSVTITATAKDGSGVSASAEIRVLPAVTQVQILHNGEDAAAISLDIGAGTTLQLTARTDPPGASDGVAWKSSNAKIATVDSSGLVTLLKSGKVTITATASDGSGKKDTVILNITCITRQITITGPRLVGAGKSVALGAVYFPEAVTNKALTWSTSDSSVATVSTSGKVTAKKVDQISTVTITATAKDGSGVFANYVMQVCPAVSWVQILYNGAEVSTLPVDIGAGNTLQLTARTGPEDASDAVTWKSSNAKIATVDASGLVTFLKTGKVTITATASDGSGKKETVTLNAVCLVKAITITGEQEVTSGKSVPLTARVTPGDATTKALTWTSSNTAAATVSSSGKVTGKAVTERTQVTITATAKDGSGVYAVHTLEVVPAASQVQILHKGVEAKTATLDIAYGTGMQLTARVLPGDAAQAVTWKSGSTRIALVDSDGTVTALSTGTVTITATTANGKKASCKITVIESEIPQYTEGDFRFTVSADQARIISYLGGETDVRIPEILQGYPVTAIGLGAFRNTGVQKVTIPRGVYDIAADAFTGCPDVTICGYMDSPAHEYARRNRLSFVPLDSVGIPLVLDQNDASYPQGCLVLWDIVQGPYTLTWSADNATKYDVKILLLDEAPDFTDSGSGQATPENTLHHLVGTTQTSITLDQELQRGKYLKVAVCAYGPGNTNQAWLTFGVKLADSMWIGAKRQRVLARAEEWYNTLWTTTKTLNLWQNVATIPAGSTVRGIPYTMHSPLYSIDSSLKEAKDFFALMETNRYSTKTANVGGYGSRFGPCYGADCVQFVYDVWYTADPAMGGRDVDWSGIISGNISRGYVEMIDWTTVKAGDAFGIQKHIMLCVAVDQNGTPNDPLDDTFTVIEQLGTTKSTGVGLGDLADGAYTIGLARNVYTYKDLTDKGYNPYCYLNLDVE